MVVSLSGGPRAGAGDSGIPSAASSQDMKGATCASEDEGRYRHHYNVFLSSACIGIQIDGSPPGDREGDDGEQQEQR